MVRQAPKALTPNYLVDFADDIAVLIKKRVDSGMSRAAFAKKMGVSTSTIHALEKGRYASAAMIERYAHALGEVLVIRR